MILSENDSANHRATRIIPPCLVLRDRVSSRRMSTLPTADLLALDTDGLKSRLSKLRRYL
jgi:hypothetical protein